MAENIQLEVVTPEKAVVSEEVKIVMAPGADGEFGVLNGHTPFLSSLNVGVLRYEDTSGTERSVCVNGGFAEALPNKVTILAESAERKEDIDAGRAREALQRAEKRLEGDRGEDLNVGRAKDALKRAQVRLSLAGGA